MSSRLSRRRRTVRVSATATAAANDQSLDTSDDFSAFQPIKRARRGVTISSKDASQTNSCDSLSKSSLLAKSTDNTNAAHDTQQENMSPVATAGLNVQEKSVAKCSATDSSNSRVSSSPAESQPPLSCPVCLRRFLSSASRLSHLKPCARRHNLTAEQLIEAINLQKRQMKERSIHGLPVSSVTLTAPRSRRPPNVSNAPRTEVSPADADIQMALAMSASLQEVTEDVHQASSGHDDLSMTSDWSATRSSSRNHRQTSLDVDESGFLTTSHTASNCRSVLRNMTPQSRTEIIANNVANFLSWEDCTVINDTAFSRYISARPAPIWQISQLTETASTDFYVQQLSGWIDHGCATSVDSLLQDITTVPCRVSLTQNTSDINSVDQFPHTATQGALLSLVEDADTHGDNDEVTVFGSVDYEQADSSGLTRSVATSHPLSPDKLPNSVDKERSEIDRKLSNSAAPDDDEHKMEMLDDVVDLCSAADGHNRRSGGEEYECGMIQDWPASGIIDGAPDTIRNTTSTSANTINHDIPSESTTAEKSSENSPENDDSVNSNKTGNITVPESCRETHSVSNSESSIVSQAPVLGELMWKHLQEEEGGDARLECSGGYEPVHRAVIRARCPRLLKTNVRHFSRRCMRHLLLYLYKGQCLCDESDALELKHLGGLMEEKALLNFLQIKFHLEELAGDKCSKYVDGSTSECSNIHLVADRENGVVENTMELPATGEDTSCPVDITNISSNQKKKDELRFNVASAESVSSLSQSDNFQPCNQQDELSRKSRRNSSMDPFDDKESCSEERMSESSGGDVSAGVVHERRLSEDIDLTDDRLKPTNSSEHIIADGPAALSDTETETSENRRYSSSSDLFLLEENAGESLTVLAPCSTRPGSVEFLSQSFTQQSACNQPGWESFDDGCLIQAVELSTAANLSPLPSPSSLPSPTSPPPSQKWSFPSAPISTINSEENRSENNDVCDVSILPSPVISSGRSHAPRQLPDGKWETRLGSAIATTGAANVTSSSSVSQSGTVNPVSTAPDHKICSSASGHVSGNSLADSRIECTVQTDCQLSSVPVEGTTVWSDASFLADLDSPAGNSVEATACAANVYKTPTAPTAFGSRVNPYRVVMKASNTPLPNYLLMLTPELKAELARIGVKPISRRKAVALLSHIYNETHPETINGKSDGKTDAAALSGRESDVQKGCVSPVSRMNSSGAASAPDSYSTAPNDEDSDDSDDDQEERTFLPTDLEDMDDISPSQQTVPESRVHDVISQFIRSRPELHEKILLYEPIWLQSLHSQLKSEGHRISLCRLMDFLDDQCITFRSESNSGRRRSPKKRKTNVKTARTKTAVAKKQTSVSQPTRANNL